MTPKEIKLIKDKINSDQREIVIEALNELRTIGNTEFLNDIIYALKHNDDQLVIGEIWKFLKDINEDEAANYFVDWIKNPDFIELRDDIISICWQTRIDFSQHIQFYTDIVLSESYINAVEAFTTIENSMERVNSEEKNRCLEKIDQKSMELDTEKSKLALELKEVIKSF